MRVARTAIRLSEHASKAGFERTALGRAIGSGTGGLDLTVADLKQLYEERTGRLWEPESGGTWLRQNYEHLDLFIKKPILDATAHIDLSGKASWLSQAGCHICKPNGPTSIIPLRIAPQSWQSLDSVDKSAFKAAIAHRLANSSHIVRRDGRICLAILFVCSATRRIKDLDNMAKLLMDSIKGKVMGDDRDVDHLSLIRLNHEGDEEYVVFRICSSTINTHTDVADLSLRHSWAGAESLRIEDFRAEPSTAACFEDI